MAGRRGPYAKSAARRDAILDAAEEVFSTTAYHCSSVTDIARRAGLTTAMVWYYFPSKGDLFAAVLKRRDDLAFRLSPRDPDDPLHELQGFVDFAVQTLPFPGVIAPQGITTSRPAPQDDAARVYCVERYALMRQRLTEILDRCHARGLLCPGIEPTRSARAIVAMMDGLQIQSLTDPDSVDVVDDLDNYLAALFVPGAWGYEAARELGAMKGRGAAGLDPASP
ncbi:TetR/AcrR family transcriptional regulator [Microbacterium sp. B2969]|uniref:TetR/AcrR family transcriptional regulator n=1 Tax=Microbacterium alkaliflavum TaxID=3248839 RepID=A0ABW7QDU0_9MICO